MESPSVDTQRKHVTSEDLIREPRDLGPHVVILGAGASRAAFPTGDAKGKFLPIMDDFVTVVGLAPLLQSYGIPFEYRNFEAIYADLCEDPEKTSLRAELESRIRDYFSAIELPQTVTLYDRLLLSLREKDAVLTFNWDPLLFDAWLRNRHLDPPPIYFLHGSIRVRCCPEHPEQWGPFGACKQCGKPWQPTPLLYPVAQKDYDANPFIHMHWQAALDLVREAFTVTVFGYSAPESDNAAVNLIHEAYLRLSNRQLEHFEVIDIKNLDALQDAWARFVPTHHLQIRQTLSDSWLGRYPRRSCEGILWPMIHGIPAETYKMPDLTELPALHEWVATIRRHERESSPSL
jgi:hypothetical protein